MRNEIQVFFFFFFTLRANKMNKFGNGQKKKSGLLDRSSISAARRVFCLCGCWPRMHRRASSAVVVQIPIFARSHAVHTDWKLETCRTTALTSARQIKKARTQHSAARRWRDATTKREEKKFNFLSTVAHSVCTHCCYSSANQARTNLIKDSLKASLSILFFFQASTSRQTISQFRLFYSGCCFEAIFGIHQLNTIVSALRNSLKITCESPQTMTSFPSIGQLFIL